MELGRLVLLLLSLACLQTTECDRFRFTRLKKASQGWSRLQEEPKVVDRRLRQDSVTATTTPRPGKDINVTGNGSANATTNATAEPTISQETKVTEMIGRPEDEPSNGKGDGGGGRQSSGGQNGKNQGQKGPKPEKNKEKAGKDDKKDCGCFPLWAILLIFLALLILLVAAIVTSFFLLRNQILLLGGTTVAAVPLPAELPPPASAEQSPGPEAPAGTQEAAAPDKSAATQTDRDSQEELKSKSKKGGDPEQKSLTKSRTAKDGKTKSSGSQPHEENVADADAAPEFPVDEDASPKKAEDE